MAKCNLTRIINGWNRPARFLRAFMRAAHEEPGVEHDRAALPDSPLDRILT
jgi:hypothetical protein